ncbi:LOW QUALITY PROTEIN: RBP1 FK506-binding protein 1 [Candida maltosa Xu316]
MSDLPQIEIVQEGDNTTFAKPGDTVTIHYDGKLTNEFDSSRKRGKPFSCVVGVGQVIPGWDISLTNNYGKGGLPKISKGTKAVLTIPSNLAYGPRGVPPIIGPNETLVFEVELLGVNGN